MEALAGEIAQSVANTSHHLQVLERARLVTAERDGLYVLYALVGEDVGALLTELRGVGNCADAGSSPGDIESGWRCPRAGG